MPIQGLLTVKELSSYLGISPYTVYKLKKRREIPFIKQNGIGLRFHREDIDEWRKSRTVKPTPRVDNSINALTLPPGYGKRRRDDKPGGICEMPKGTSKTRHNFGYGAIYLRKTETMGFRGYIDS